MSLYTPFHLIEMNFSHDMSSDKEECVFVLANQTFCSAYPSKENILNVLVNMSFFFIVPFILFRPVLSFFSFRKRDPDREVSILQILFSKGILNPKPY